jgi:hypothetical protein
MPNASDNTLGAIYDRGLLFHQRITAMPGLTPPRPEDQPIEFGKVLQAIEAANAAEAAAQTSYGTAVDARRATFTTGPDAMKRRLTRINKAATASLGPGSDGLTRLIADIRRVRGTRLIKAPADPAKAARILDASQQSYGSQAQYFADLLDHLALLADYSPQNDLAKLPQLRALLTDLRKANANFGTTATSLAAARTTRNVHYADLHQRGQRLKAAVADRFGSASSEFLSIKGLEF